MGHPNTRAERRHARRRIIRRRVRMATWWWHFHDGLGDPAIVARWAKWNPLVCCSRCQWDAERPAAWRWDRELDERGLVLAPPRIESMG